MRNRKRTEERREDSPDSKRDTADQNAGEEKAEESSRPASAVDPSPACETEQQSWSLWMAVYCAIGVALAVAVGIAYAWFVSQLHENNMYFSRIETVEREISFRTETGLFYSYFKQLVEAKSLSKGFHQLMYDNITEHGHTINVLERMNIHQEVALGVMFRLLRVPFLMHVEPVYFYLNTIWSLHAMYMIAIFCTVWAITSSWAGGMLSVALFFVNRMDTTRIWYTMPLRESFSMPFIYAQLLFVTLYFQRSRSALPKELLLAAITVCTFCLSVTWQFAQFVLLLQAFALYSAQALQMVPTHKVRNVMLIQLVCLSMVCVLQFGNTLIPRSLVISFILASLTVFSIQGRRGLRSRSFVGSFLKMIGYTALMFAIAVAINITIKMLVAEEADRHIYNFVRAKLGLTSPWAERDFDVLLYVCDPSFKGLPSDTWTSLWNNFLLLPYVATAAVLLILLAASVLAHWWRQSNPSKVKSVADEDGNVEDCSDDSSGTWLGSRPDLAYHILYTCFFGFVAMTTVRFKYLWTPHMCVLGAVGVSDKQFFQWLLSLVKVKSERAARVLQHLVGLGLVAYIMYSNLPAIQEQLAYLGEFYDPDTVQLMTWIMKKTKKSAAFAGSMQLLAGVKLCTGRPITNHPHYEDRRLRDRTRQIYQFYGKRAPEVVHRNLQAVGTSYIILENSICYAQNDERWPGCRLPDIIDRCNGHTLDEPTGENEQGLVESEYGRFCSMVEVDERYKTLFRQAFVNKTFRVYKVLKADTRHKKVK